MYHVSVDTVHPYLLGSSYLSFPRWYHIQSISSDVFCSRLFTCTNHFILAFLHLSVIFSTISLSLMLSFLTWYLSVAACPFAHLNFCHFPFLHVGAGHWHCLHRVQHSWLNYHLVYISLNVWCYPLIL